MDIRDRIIGMERLPATSLNPHPKNWRTHPKHQQDAVAGALQELGIVGALIVRKNGKHYQILDGHLRSGVDRSIKWPCLITDLSDEEAEFFLKTYDPLTSLAGMDAKLAEELFGSFESSSQALNDMVAGLADQASRALLDMMASDDGGAVSEDDGDDDGDSDGFGNQDATSIMSFTLTTQQEIMVKNALAKVRNLHDISKLGDALAMMSEEYLGGA